MISNFPFPPAPLALVKHNLLSDSEFEYIFKKFYFSITVDIQYYIIFRCTA